MSERDYTISADKLTSVDYEILVIGYPKNELEDLLTDLVKEHGRIARSRYEDFLIAHCIANLNQFMAHITTITSVGTELDLLLVREEVVTLILKYNESLKPENIVINKKKLLKLRTDKDKEDEVQALIDNPFWNQSFYDKDGNYTPITKKTADESIYVKKPRADNSATSFENKNNIEKIKSLSELSYEEVRVWWERFNEYIKIKRYSTLDVDRILTFRYFHNSTSFDTFVVSHCVANIEEIYERIDGMGISVDPAKIVAELYSLCKGVNPSLTFDRFKELRDDDESDTPRSNSGQSSQATQPSFGFGTARKKEKKPSFRDVPKEDLLALSGNMKVSLVGQDEAIDTITEAIKRASVGLKDPIRPIGSFLFAGRTGVGKSTSTKVLADNLIRTKKNRIIIDCSEYSSDHEYAKLIGAPHGYMGHDQGGVLTNAIAEDPFSVVVFDEIEKASSKVYDLLLQILDEGRLTDGKGVSVSFKDSIVIMTSNIGVKEIDAVGKTIGFGDVATLTEVKKSKALDEALKKKFKPEFLNRIDAIVHFKDLTDDDYMKIIELELEKLNTNLKTNSTEYKEVYITFDKKIKEFIFEKGVDVKYGARPIKRAIEKYISNDIAGMLLEADIDTLVEIKVTTLKDKVKLKPIKVKKDTKSLLMYAEDSN